MNLTKEKKNRFEKHPVISIIFVYLFFLFVWILVDVVYSNIFSSFTHTYEVFKSEKPIGHVNVSNKTFRWVSRHSGEYDTQVHLNNFGFRNKEDFNEQTIRNKQLIFALGDSTTAGFENSYKSSYPKVLNSILGNEYIVFNTGVRGFDTNQVIINYTSKLQKLKPDALVYMICENDLEGNINPELYPSIKNYYGKGVVEDDGRYRFIEPVSGVERFKIQMKVVLAKNLQLSYRYIFTPLISLMKKTSYTKEEIYDSKQIDKLKELLGRLDVLAQEQNMPLYITWFPYLKYANEENTKIPKYYQDVKKFVVENLTHSSFISTYEPLIKYYSRYPSDENTRFLFPYNLHATDFGSEKLANIIGKVLKIKLYNKK